MAKYRYIGHLLILLAATLWATLGLFYQYLIVNYELSLYAVIFWRAIVAAITLWTVLIFFRRSHLMISKTDWGLFFLLGLLGVAGFYIAYIMAISLTGMGIAAVLLYTAPIWVTIYSAIVLKETFDLRKTSALILSISGIILVGHMFNFQNARLNISGLTAGLLSGLGYAAYIILNKYAVERKYSPWVISAYALGIGGLILVLFQSPGEQRLIFTTPAVILWLVILGVVPTLCGAVAFNAGLNYLPASSASIIATLEPVVAITLGWVFFAEKIDTYQIIGSVLIITAAVTIQFKYTKNKIGPDNLTPEEIFQVGYEESNKSRSD